MDHHENGQQVVEKKQTDRAVSINCGIPAGALICYKPKMNLIPRILDAYDGGYCSGSIDQI